MQTIKSDRGPKIEIHFMNRIVQGNGIAIEVWGEMLVAAKDYVYARELKLNTLKGLVLTPMSGDHYMFGVQKWIYSKGTYDNYASIDIFSPTGTVYEMTAGGRVTLQAPNNLPYLGSLWLDFIALGE